MGTGESDPGSADADAPTLVERQHEPEREARALPRGTCLSRYVVLGEIGVGGMGHVVSAYDPELNRKVALKLLHERPGRSERLLHEARLLAKLSHANVITVYGVESWNDDLFIAMELVDGETLRRWFAARRRGWREIVDTFVLAGRGLAAAHAAKLVHRDFKPENVLIGRDGRVRVTDFGLARSLAPTDATPGDAGDEPVKAGTRAYMAPEQHEGRDVDARSDQYSFCVALHEALYGELPQRGRRSSRPRTRAPGWLRAHVLRGLAIDPRDRFPSMDALLDAITRDPWIRRAPWTMGLVSTALVLALPVVAWRAMAERPCSRSAAAWAAVWNADKQAAIEAAIAHNGAGDPTVMTTWTSARSVLDAYGAAWIEIDREACLATHRAEQSEGLLALRRACLAARASEVEALVHVLEDPARALVLHAARAAASLTPLEACADAALAQVEPPRADDATAVASVREQLGRVTIEGAFGRSKQALTLAEDALARAEVLAYAPLVAEARLRLGHAQARRGDAEAAERNLVEAQWLAARVRHDEAAALAATTLVRAVARERGRTREGLAWARHAEAALARIHAAPEQTQRLHCDVAMISSALGHDDEAEAMLERVLTTATEARPLDRIDVERSLAAVYVRRGRLEDAEHLLAVAARRTRAALGPEHPEQAWIELGSARLADARGHHGEAQRRLESAIALVERSLGPSDLEVVSFVHALADSHRAHGDLAAAARSDEHAADLLADALGEHPAVAEALHRLASTLEVAGQLEEARHHHERALDLWGRTRGHEHPDLAYALTSLGLLDLQVGASTQAVARLERALDLRGGRGLDPRLLAHTQWALARALHQNGGDSSRVRQLALRAHDTLALDRGPNDPFDAESVDGIAAIDRFLATLTGETGGTHE